MPSEESLKKINILSDNELIGKITTGELMLFEVLMRRYNPVLYKIGRSYGFNHQDTEDLMQETHFSAYSNLNQFEFKATYKTWLSKIMIHKCLYKLSYGYKKNEQPHSELISENTEPMYSSKQTGNIEANFYKKEFSIILESALQHLSLPYRIVFMLREIEGFSVLETSRLLNITRINVKVRLNRAKAMLRKRLKQLYSTADIYEFNLVYCNDVVKKVFEKIFLNH